MVVVVGLRDFHPHGYGLERGLDPSTPLLTTAQSWGRKRARVFTCGTPVVFDSWTVWGVALVDVRALLRLHSRGVPCPSTGAQCPSVCVACIECGMVGVLPCCTIVLSWWCETTDRGAAPPLPPRGCF